MVAFVLDASVAISWCFPGDPTEDTPYSRRILQELVSNDAVVPEIWAFEIANSILFPPPSARESPSSKSRNIWIYSRHSPFGLSPRPSGLMSIWNVARAVGTFRLTMPPIWISRSVRAFPLPRRTLSSGGPPWRRVSR